LTLQENSSGELPPTKKPTQLDKLCSNLSSLLCDRNSSNSNSANSTGCNSTGSNSNSSSSSRTLSKSSIISSQHPPSASHTPVFAKYQQTSLAEDAVGLRDILVCAFLGGKPPWADSAALEQQSYNVHSSARASLLFPYFKQLIRASRTDDRLVHSGPRQFCDLQRSYRRETALRISPILLPPSYLSISIAHHFVPEQRRHHVSHPTRTSRLVSFPRINEFVLLQRNPPPPLYTHLSSTVERVSWAIARFQKEQKYWQLLTHKPEFALIPLSLPIESRPSTGLTLNLSSNNPFRNRAASPNSAGFPSPLDPSPRPASRNPFLDSNYTGNKSPDKMSFTTSAPPKPALNSNAADLFVRHRNLLPPRSQIPPFPALFI
jgi:hypothetical protein